MIKSKKELNEYLSYERSRYGFKSVFQYWIHLFMHMEQAHIWQFQKRLRITEYHKNCNHKIRFLLSQRKLNSLRHKYNFEICLNVFDKGLRIMHIGPILTNSKARVGQNCSIHINTGIAAQGITSEAPTIGDNVVIGFGSCIIGGCHIANGIAIGANALVNKSFEEENIAIAGVPARKISNNGSREWGKQA